MGWTPAELAEIAKDPRTTEADLALLSPAERAQVQQLKGGQGGGGMMQMAGDALNGVLKGAGNTAFDLGNIVHKTPVIGTLTDRLATLLGPEGTNPDAAFAQTPEEVKPKNTAEKVGKGAEQVAEFFIPANASRLATIKGLTRLIPDAASPKSVALLNKAIAIVGRSAGEAGSAAGVSATHGDENPGVPAAVAGGANLTGEAAKKLAPLLTTPWGKRIAPLVAAALSMNAMGDMGLPLAGELGVFGLIQQMARKGLGNPSAVRGIRTVAPKLMDNVGRAGAGTISVTGLEANDEPARPQRRRLQ